jgi:glycosyltransferase involved in cell wall biosynthesis
MNFRHLSQPVNFENFIIKYQKEVVEELVFGNREILEIKPMISVMIRTYNHCDYIKQSIESVLSQKVNFDFEILLGDDQSNDGTSEICLKYAKKYPDKIRLFLHRRVNNFIIHDKITPTFMFSYNLYNCRGNYIAFLCGDDYWTDELKLQKQYDYLENNLDVSLCFHSSRKLEVLDDGREIEHEIVKNQYYLNSSLLRNKFEYLPQPMFETLNEDLFIYYLSKCIGKQQFIDNVKPTIIRHQSKGIWYSSKDELYKTKFRILTFKKLLETFKLTNQRDYYASLLYFQLLEGWKRIKYAGVDNLDDSTRLNFLLYLRQNNMLLRFLLDRKNFIKYILKRNVY